MKKKLYFKVFNEHRKLCAACCLHHGGTVLLLFYSGVEMKPYIEETKMKALLEREKENKMR